MKYFHFVISEGRQPNIYKMKHIPYVTLQFICIAIPAVAFLIFALAAGHFDWWEGQFSWFQWIFDLF